MTLPFHPLIDLLNGAFGVQDGDTHETIAARIERETAVLGDEVRGTTPFLRGLLCAGTEDAEQMRMDPKLRRAGIFDAVRQYLAALARTRPIVSAFVFWPATFSVGPWISHGTGLCGGARRRPPARIPRDRLPAS